MRRFGGKVLTVFMKDVKSEARTRDVLGSVFIFALLSVLIISFAMEPGSEAANAIAPGVLWIAITFAAVLGFGRSFVLEKEHGCLDGLLLCPVERDVIYWGKVMGSFVFMVVVEAIILPLFFGLLNLPFNELPRVAVVAFLTTLGFSSVGPLFSAMAVSTRARDIILPILFFPAVAPLVIAAVKSTGPLLAAYPWSDVMSWLQLIAGFDVVFLMLSSFVFQYVLEG